MRRAAYLFLSSLLIPGALSLLSACGGSSNNNGCVGHGCANSPINLAEGGEVRLEVAYVKDDAPEMRTSVWFASDQSPASRPWPRDPKFWNKAPGPGDMLCSDMRGGKIWPSGVPDSRTYVDVGDNVTLSGGGKDLVFKRGMNVEDNAYRHVSDIGYAAQLEPGNVPVDTEYTVKLPGMGSFAAQTITPGVYLPPNYDVTFPDMKQTIYIPLNKDFPWTWNAPKNKDDYEFAFVAFIDQINPIVFCIGPNSGQMVIPKEMLAIVPPGGNVLHGVVDHRVEKLLNNRRLDLLGVNCRVGQYVVTTGSL